MILRLTKQFDFQMAHALDGYDGKCRNIHGHNYKLFVTVESPAPDNIYGNCSLQNDNPKRGMVMDFGDIKRLVEINIIEPFDHAFVVPQNSPFENTSGTKLIVLPFQPTSETLLLQIATLLKDKLPSCIRLHSLRLNETDTSSAELIL